MTARQAVNALGYQLTRNQRDAFGRKRAYRTSPIATMNGGPTNYFDTAAQVERWAKQVQQVREWQSEILPIEEEQ